MAKFKRPKFEDAMLRARKATDPRSEFEVYRDVARKLVERDLAGKLKDLPISDEHKEQIVETETYSLAQPAHLSDVSRYQPNYLLAMLNKLHDFSAQPPDESEH